MPTSAFWTIRGSLCLISGVAVNATLAIVIQFPRTQWSGGKLKLMAKDLHAEGGVLAQRWSGLNAEA